MISASNLSKHCKAKHNKKSKALKEGEKPIKPLFMNWKKYIKDPSLYTGHRYSELIVNPEKFFEPDEKDIEEGKTVMIQIEKPKRSHGHARESKLQSKRTLHLRTPHLTKQIKKCGQSCLNPKIPHGVGFVTKR